MKLLKTIDNKTLAINFVMGKHGWARLEFVLDDIEWYHALSYVFEPFDDLKNWLDKIAGNDLPAQVNMDEEGCISCLIANPNGNDDIGFIVQDYDTNRIFINTIINRHLFVEKFRAEFTRFFEQDFDKEHW